MELITEWPLQSGAAAPAALALGYFDGVHLGHAAVVAAAEAAAKQQQLALAAFTFTLPAHHSHKGSRLQTTAQKHAALAALGVRLCYDPPFEAFKQLSPGDYFTTMLVQAFNARVLVCGENYFYGANAAGDVALLRRLCEEQGVQLVVVPTTLYQGQPVSSSRIRQAVAAGNLPDANTMLGRPFALLAPVQQASMPQAFAQRFAAGLQSLPNGAYATGMALGQQRAPCLTFCYNGCCQTHVLRQGGALPAEEAELLFYQRLGDADGQAPDAASLAHWEAPARAVFTAQNKGDGA